MSADHNAVEWLRMMSQFSHLADTTRATMARIALEMEQLRAAVAAPRQPSRPVAHAA